MFQCLSVKKIRKGFQFYSIAGIMTCGPKTLDSRKMLQIEEPEFSSNSFLLKG
jgi:hypothetical protein